MTEIHSLASLEEARIESSNFFVQRPGETANRLVNLEDLRPAFNQDTAKVRALLNSIVRSSGNVRRDTRAFWNSKRRGLEAMVRPVGCGLLC